MHVTSSTPDAILKELIDVEFIPKKFGGRCDDAFVSAEYFIREQSTKESRMQQQHQAEEASFQLEEREAVAALYSSTLYWIGVCKDETLSTGSAKQPKLLEGYMKKQGGLVPLWRKYYFVLRGTTLLYKNYPEDVIPNNAVDLRRAVIMQGHELSLERRNHLSANSSNIMAIDTPQRSFVILFNTEAERNTWVATMQRTLQ